MDLYLIEVRDMDEQFRTIRRGVRAGFETAKHLVVELAKEYIPRGYTASPVRTKRYEDGSFSMYLDLWSNNDDKHDLNIVLSDGRMDTIEHRIWIPNEDNGKVFASNEEMAEYLINNYNL